MGTRLTKNLHLPAFEERLRPALRSRFRNLSSPAAIQTYLDSLPYIAEELDRSPLRVMADGQAHCLDGGIFAALALSRLGHPPLILDLVPVPGLDDDHVLALFRVQGGWGCVAKSNFPMLRFREPVHRSLRELVMTYFEVYFNLDRKKCLLGYTRPLDLRTFPSDWMWSEEGVSGISRRLYARKPVLLIPKGTAVLLTSADDRAFQAATLGIDRKWVYGVRDTK